MNAHSAVMCTHATVMNALAVVLNDSCTCPFDVQTQRDTVSHSLRRILLTVRIFVQPASSACHQVLNQQRACSQQCCATAQETRPASKPTPVDTTAYDRMNRHGSLSTVYFFTRPLHLRSLGARDANASHRLGTFGNGGAKRGPGALTSGSSPGPCAAGQLRSPSLSPNNTRWMGRAGRRAPAANQSRTSHGHAAKAACAPGLLLRPTTMRSHETRSL